jgi:hypothetical protein
MELNGLKERSRRVSSDTRRRGPGSGSAGRVRKRKKQSGIRTAGKPDPGNNTPDLRRITSVADDLFS